MTGEIPTGRKFDRKAFHNESLPESLAGIAAGTFIGWSDIAPGDAVWIGKSDVTICSPAEAIFQETTKGAPALLLLDPESEAWRAINQYLMPWRMARRSQWHKSANSD